MDRWEAREREALYSFLLLEWLWNGEPQARVSGHCQCGSEFPLSQHFTSGKSLPATAAVSISSERAERGKDCRGMEIESVHRVDIR